MSNRTISLSDRLYEYLLGVSLRESELLQRLRIETEKIPMARMQISPEQGQFMALIVRILAAKRIIEIGVFTGYSSLCMASAMPEDGQITACDTSSEWTSIARRYWEEGGVDQKIHLKLAPALETLNSLISSGQSSTFDLIFIDADKENYLAYYESSLQLLRSGGVIMVDNVLWGGHVVDATRTDPETVSIRKLNEFLKSDHRVDLSLVPIGDGLTLVRKK